MIHILILASDLFNLKQTPMKFSTKNAHFEEKRQQWKCFLFDGNWIKRVYVIIEKLRKSRT